MKHQNNFKKKYGIDAIDFVEKADLEYFGVAKTNGIQSILKTYAQKKEMNIEFNDEFYKDLVEAFAEGDKRFPYNDKIKFDSDIYQLEPSPVNPSIPKSKGVLEDFKDIVSKDIFRENMSAVYVSEDGFLYGTDAHKLIKFKNNDYSEYAGKLINLKLFIDSKGKKLDFVDAKPLQYELVIPKNNPEVVENLPTYNFYNFSKSVVALKKLLSDDIFNIIFDFKGELFGFNPILITDVFHFALCKGFNTFTLEYSTPNRAIVFKFKDDSLGLTMPIMVVEDSLRGTTKITIEKIISDYGYSKEMPKTKVTKTVKYPVETEKEVPYKKYEGGIDKTTYIPRRDISYIILRNGEKLSGNDIIDGVYRVNKMATGGGVDKLPKERQANKKYTHFAVNKSTGKIVNGWETVSDVESLKEYAIGDLKDMDLNPKDFKILSKETIIRSGINPFDYNNWRKTEYANGGGVDKDADKDIWQIKNKDEKYWSKSINNGKDIWSNSPDMGYTNTYDNAKDIINILNKSGYADLDIVKYDKDWYKKFETGEQVGSQMKKGGTLFGFQKGKIGDYVLTQIGYGKIEKVYPNGFDILVYDENRNEYILKHYPKGSQDLTISKDYGYDSSGQKINLGFYFTKEMKEKLNTRDIRQNKMATGGGVGEIKFEELVGNKFSIERGSGTTTTNWSKEDLLEEIKRVIKHELFDRDFYYNWTDEGKEYSNIFDKYTLNPMLKDIDKTLNEYFVMKKYPNNHILEFKEHSKIQSIKELGQGYVDNWFKTNPHISPTLRNDYKKYREKYAGVTPYAKGGGVGSNDLDDEINQLYKKSGFISTDFNWKLKLLEMLQDQSIEAYNIYKKLSKEQKAEVLQEQFEVDNDMGSDGDGTIKTTKENLKILLNDAKNGKKYETGGNIKLSPDEKKMIRNSYWANNDVDIAMKYVSEKIPASKHQPAREYMQTLYKKGGKVTPAKQKKVAKVMKEWKKGELHIGTSDKIVKDQKQAVAIALSEAGLSKPKRGWKHKRKA